MIKMDIDAIASIANSKFTTSPKKTFEKHTFNN